MSRKFITAWLFLIVFLGAGTVFAQGPQGVEFTIHNLSTSSPDGNPAWPEASYNYQSANVEEICIFCHTPHGGANVTPLWNRSYQTTEASASGSIDGAGYFTHYNSTTLTSWAKDGTRPVNEESLLCMTCHDGSIAANRVINTSNAFGEETNPPAYIQGGFEGFFFFPVKTGGAPGNESGFGDLTDDHPVSFSYYNAQLEEETSGENGLRTVAQALASGVRFFGSSGPNGDFVECSSCHDPHVMYDTDIPGAAAAGADPVYTPFLIRSNAQSGLCLSCHVK